MLTSRVFSLLFSVPGMLVVLAIAAMPSTTVMAAEGKIKGTGGVSTIDGSSGGGLVPWATLGSAAVQGETGLTGFVSRARVDDFNLDVTGAAINFNDRIELSVARQKFTILDNNARIEQNRIGLKVKLAGDLLYGQLPQISAGINYSDLRDPGVAMAVGAEEESGGEFYISTARAWLNSLGNRTAMLNLNLRYSEANQYGLLGFGGDEQDRRVHLELAAAVFVTRSIAIGTEYRQKPDNLSALTEGSAHDLFLAWFPSKNISLTAAWVDLGEIAGAARQTGFYLSVQGAL